MELLSVQSRGALFTICIFLIAVVIVHVAKLAILGWCAYKKREPKKQAEKPEPQEPVYYLVEKKKKTSPQYKKPKKFNFQK